MPTQAPVLVVGGGPAGLTATIELLRRGIPVRCVDRAAGPSNLSKALGVWPRTLELLRRFGGEDVLAARALPQTRMRYYSSGRQIAALRYGRTTTPVIMPQPDVEHLLHEALRRAGGEVEWNTEFLGSDQDDAGVTVRLRRPDGTITENRFAYVVGSDGASSRVRADLGISFTGSTHELRFVVADIDLDGPLEHDVTHYFCSPRGILVTCGLPSGRSRVFTSAPPDLTDDAVDLAAVQHLVDERGPGGLRLSNPEWISTFAVHARHADRTRVGRVFLVGDAAHIHSPAGGQGLNTGVTDAQNLAWKLALVWRQAARPELLDTYATERGQVARAVVRQADAQTRIWLLRKAHQVFLRDNLVRLASGLRLFNVSYIPWLAGLRTVYAAPQKPRRDRAGFRPGALVPAVPMAGGGTLRAALTDLRYTILVSTGTEVGPRLHGLLTRLGEQYRDTVEVRVHHPRAGTLTALPGRPAGTDRRGTVVLVRPDGHVDLRLTARTAGRLADRLDALLRPATEVTSPDRQSVIRTTERVQA